MYPVDKFAVVVKCKNEMQIPIYLNFLIHALTTYLIAFYAKINLL